MKKMPRHSERVYDTQARHTPSDVLVRISSDLQDLREEKETCCRHAEVMFKWRSRQTPELDSS